jgi:DNA-binding NtrC family response regulator
MRQAEVRIAATATKEQPMTSPLTGSRIVIADDDGPIRELLCDILEPEGAEVIAAATGKEALTAINEQGADLAFLDVRMPAPDGLTILQQLREQGNDLPVVIITAQESSTLTIEAMRHGAYDYLNKPFDTDDVVTIAQRALEQRRLSREVTTLDQSERDPRDIMIGRSAPMLAVYKLIGRVSASAATVLVTGESGTGKELVAQMLHRSSPRAAGPFVAVNCAALPETLLESELFGHEKGAFTGAMTQRKGRFEQANKGTLFLDEIGEITPSTQKKLLRVLQERSFERVGGNTPVKIDVRVIAATNRDLLSEAQSGAFREDLYYRLNVINIHMPPLRERKDDIPLLVEHFLARQANGGAPAARQISAAALEQLTAYDWPGNVRQLENTIERAAVLAQGAPITPDHLHLDEPAPLDQQALNAVLEQLLDQGDDLAGMLTTLRARLMALTLTRAGGDRAGAARRLGIGVDDL